MNSDDKRARGGSSTRLPPGVLGCDYLKFLQLRIDARLLTLSEKALDDDRLMEATNAIRCGAMRSARPAMKVFFDGCQFWVASHLHRYLAARRLDASHQEFWCEIEPGCSVSAVEYARSKPGFGGDLRLPPTRAFASNMG
ncbi:hypothetical protein M3I53_32245 [Paraburkholderia sp. CNPSo 3272]|uniref:hypothetical protein n=1 Tax=Paraburkholderia sp. CNPSo 3272 TaxID=2940931 RepID=UPI0020B8DFAE|nr:hypothetical protein [Paraburkholderia sp. CNPSo 3272]MCP3727741.1 hypothetical protein [Paraburkholderia sp. CNPSo 3272]